MQEYKLALIGYGGVNQAMASLLTKAPDQLAEKLGFKLRIVAISDSYFGAAKMPQGLSAETLNCLTLDEGCLSALPGGYARADNYTIITQSGADIIVEATVTDATTGQPAVEHCEWAFTHGKHLVTTNKGPVALAGNRLTALANKHCCRFEYEGTVMSGTPVLRFVKNQLKGCAINGFEGVLNGTCNYVLGLMEQRAAYSAALADAQQRGYAEANPEADVEGYDVRLKVVILANELFNAQLTPNDVSCAGITEITPELIEQATQEGARWKLIGKAQLQPDGSVKASVSPQKLPPTHALHGVNGAQNAISFATDLLGDVAVFGPGAGKIETAYALLSDIIAIHQSQRK